MADATDFQFAIVGEDASAPAFQAVVDRADKAQKKMGAGAERTRRTFSKMVGPAKELAPGLNRALAPFEKLNRVRAGFAEAFGRDGSTVRRASATSAASLARTSSAGGALRAQFVRAATGGRVLTGGLGQVGQAAGLARSGLLATEAAGGAAAAEVGAVGAAAGAAEAGLGGAAAAAGGLATGLGAIALAVPAALAGGALLAAKYASPFARAGQEVKRTSDLIGMNAGALQRWRGAAERAGLSGDAATSGLANLGQDLHDLQYGQGDAVKAQLLTRMGVRLPRPGERVDQDEVMRQISDKLAGMKDPYSRAHAARILGVEGMLPMLSKGRQAIQADMAGYDKTGAAFSDPELAKADDYGRRLTNFDQSRKGLGKAAAVKAMDLSGGAVDLASGAVQGMTGAAMAADSSLRGLSGAAKDIMTELLGIKPAAAEEVRPELLPPRPGEPMRPRPPAEVLRRVPGEQRYRDSVARTTFVPARRDSARPMPSGTVVVGNRIINLRDERILLEMLRRHGATNTEAAVITANAAHESGINPGREGDQNLGPGRTAWGLLQWREGRRGAFARMFGHDIRRSTGDEQVRFALAELRGQTPDRGAKRAGDLLRADPDPYRGNAAFVHHFERSGDQGRDVRERNAIMRQLLAANPDFAPSNAASSAAAPGEVHVYLHGAPSGTKTVTKSPKGSPPLRVVRAMSDH